MANLTSVLSQVDKLVKNQTTAPDFNATSFYVSLTDAIRNVVQVELNKASSALMLDEGPSSRSAYYHPPLFYWPFYRHFRRPEDIHPPLAFHDDLMMSELDPRLFLDHRYGRDVNEGDEDDEDPRRLLSSFSSNVGNLARFGYIKNLFASIGPYLPSIVYKTILVPSLAPGR